MKRLASLILTIVLIAALLPAQVLAAPNEKLIALTFDDGPAGSNTQMLLDGLRERGARCTFFLVGYQAVNRPSLVRQMWEDGHQIANHSYDHPAMTGKTDAEIQSQLSRTASVLNNALGFELSYCCRPPYGDFNDRVLKAINAPCFFWSMDTYDWKSQDADAVYNEFIKQAKDGSLVLLHDTHKTSVIAALRAIDTLQAQGYKFVTASELFYRRGITLQNAKMYYSAYPSSYGTAEGFSTPVISSEITESGRTVTITGDGRCRIYYTTNGQTPNPANSRLYTGPISVTNTVNIKAVCVMEWNGLKSRTASATVTYTPSAAPEISISDGTVSMSCTTAGASVYYTTDGSTPNRNSSLYTGSFEASPDTSYKAVSIAAGYDRSPVSLLTLSRSGHIYNDLAVDSWCYDDVDRAVEAGIFYGVTDTSFEPNTTFTRAMLTAVLYRMAGSPDTEGLTEPFTDIDESTWCYDALLWAYENGIVSGYDDGTFRPKTSISRQALCAMLARYMRYEGKDINDIESGILDSFSDGKNVSRGFAADVDILCTLGIIRGYEDGTLRPLNSSTRAQAAVMIMRMLDAMDSVPDVIKI